MGSNIKDNGREKRGKGLVSKHGQMEQIMRATGKKICSMDREPLLMLTVLSMWAIGGEVKLMVPANSHKQMEQHMKVNG